MDDLGLAGKDIGPFGQQQNQCCQWRQTCTEGTGGTTETLQKQGRKMPRNGKAIISASAMNETP